MSKTNESSGLAISRYSRQELVIGKEAQEKLEQSKVTIIGIGALGSVVANLLARSGVGKLILIDRDIVEESNLQRQILFTEKDLGKSKAICAKEKLQEINSQAVITGLAIHLNPKNIASLKKHELNLVIDCTDNLKTRLLINDYCKKEKIPWIFGSAIKTTGQAMAVYPENPCLSCFVKEVSLETCEQVGVLNAITSIIGSLQADLAVKILTDKEPPYLRQFTSELHYFDLEKNDYRKLKVSKNPGCKPCNGIYDYLNKKEDTTYIKFCSSGKYQVEGKPLSLEKLNKKLKTIAETDCDGLTLKFQEMLIFADGRALIKAKSEEEAQAIYSKWVGN